MIICIANQKGGTGKTTTAINLSHALAMMGRRTLLIDLDPQGHAGLGLGVGKGKEMADLLDGARLPDCILQVDRLGKNLAIVRSNTLTAEAEMRLQNHPIGREHILGRRIGRDLGAARAFDFVIIDTPPQIGLLTINALTAADLLLIPLRLEQLAVDGMLELSSTLRACQREGYDVRLGWIVPTMAMPTREHRRILATIRGRYGRHVVTDSIPRTIKLAEAQGRHRTIWEHAPRSAASRAYADLAGRILNGRSG